MCLYRKLYHIISYRIRSYWFMYKSIPFPCPFLLVFPSVVLFLVSCVASFLDVVSDVALDVALGCQVKGCRR